MSFGGFDEEDTAMPKNPFLDDSEDEVKDNYDDDGFPIRPPTQQRQQTQRAAAALGMKTTTAAAAASRHQQQVKQQTRPTTTPSTAAAASTASADVFADCKATAPPPRRPATAASTTSTKATTVPVVPAVVARKAPAPTPTPTPTPMPKPSTSSSSSSSSSSLPAPPEPTVLAVDMRPATAEDASSVAVEEVGDAEQHRQRNIVRKDKVRTAVTSKLDAIAVEARKLRHVESELRKLDQALVTNIDLLRGEIEHVDRDVAYAQRQFTSAETAYVAAKQRLQKHLQKKKLLTQHLEVIIVHNEKAKAKKLDELMREMGLADDDDGDAATTAPATSTPPATVTAADFTATAAGSPPPSNIAAPATKAAAAKKAFSSADVSSFSLSK